MCLHNSYLNIKYNIDKYYINKYIIVNVNENEQQNLIPKENLDESKHRNIFRACYKHC
ncbi:hypothetical protein NTGBS_510041 [Candidatus Nitrotoga sp. BS]|nr:hypothetical protein NTGBS_510041 [Candidatus Nitrotoga sp. BS]